MTDHFPNHICETCGKAFVNLRRLERHKGSHDKGPFKCDICLLEFSNSYTMDSHKRRKHGKWNLYKCPKCEERFCTLNRRVIHLAEVHGETHKKYKCQFCPREFSTSGEEFIILFWFSYWSQGTQRMTIINLIFGSDILYWKEGELIAEFLDLQNSKVWGRHHHRTALHTDNSRTRTWVSYNTDSNPSNL